MCGGVVHTMSTTYLAPKIMALVVLNMSPIMIDNMGSDGRDDVEARQAQGGAIIRSAETAVLRCKS